MRVEKNAPQIRELLQTIRDKPKFSRMLGYSIQCLTSMAFDDVSCEELIEEGAIETILDALDKQDPPNERLLGLLATLLSKVGRNPAIVQMLLDKVGAERLAAFFKRAVEYLPQLAATSPEAAASLQAILDAIKRLGSQSPQFLSTLHSCSLFTTLLNSDFSKITDSEVLISLASVLSMFASANPAWASAIASSALLKQLVEIARSLHNPALSTAVLELVCASPAHIQIAIESIGADLLRSLLFESLAASPFSAALQRCAVALLSGSTLSSVSDVERNLAALRAMLPTLAALSGADLDRALDQTIAILQDLSTLLLAPEHLQHFTSSNGLALIADLSKFASGSIHSFFWILEISTLAIKS